MLDVKPRLKGVVDLKARALVVGGSNGIGLAIVHRLLERNYEYVYVVDYCDPDYKLNDRIDFIRFNLINQDYSIFDHIQNIDTLIITAGFGRVAPFESILDIEIINSFAVNALAPIRIIHRYYNQINSMNSFYCAVISSIAGLVSSPLFSVHGATKASLCNFMESINIELEKKGSPNRILNVAPGSIEGTRFDNNENKLELISDLADEIIERTLARETLFIPNYEEVYKSVLERYHMNTHEFGLQSYDYKESSGRVSHKPKVKIGYLSGTFDLFHIGHLNILRRAKQYCDYLVVGVHQDASHKNKETFIPVEERVAIVNSVKYVDEVIEAFPEDDSAYEVIKYDYLFVGSDYKGTPRFERYERFFQDKNVKIVYLPYTTHTNSTKLRALIEQALRTNLVRG